MVELAVRLVFSLAVVVGLLLLTVKIGGRRFRPRNGAAVRIVHRQALSRGTAVAVVEVGNRVLVLGTTEHQVNVLAELEEGELDAPTGLTMVDTTLDPASQVIALEDVRATHPAPVEAAVEHVAETTTDPAPRRRAGSHAARPAPKRRSAPEGPLAGSILSPQTWRQALGVATGRAS